MSQRDIIALIISFAYPTVLLVIAEGLHRFARVPADLTRKFVHVGAGMWIWGAFALFDSAWWRVVPFAGFILVNYLNYRTKLTKSVETGGAGTVWFAISTAFLLLIVAWRDSQTSYGDPVTAVMVIAGVMAMTWGDAAAALVGQRLGRHQYRVYLPGRGGLRSVEGSLTMVVVSAVAIFLTFLSFATLLAAHKAVVNGQFSELNIEIGRLLGYAVLLGIVAALVEAVTPLGLDNLTVPIITAGVGWLLYQQILPDWRLAVGLALSGVIGYVAYRRRSLSVSGALGAVVTGTSIFAFGGLTWGLLLIIFFVTSTLLSHYRHQEKERVAAEKFDKGSVRDWGQVIANGGVAALLALVHLLNPHPFWLAAFVGALATVNADTWATELGVLSKSPPRSITSGKQVAVGTSGGVTALGTGAAAVGALLIGVAAVLLLLLLQPLFGWGAELSGGQLFVLPVVALVGGVAGAMFDSLLGATVQVMYYSPSRQKETEKRLEADGMLNLYRRGLRWLDNDAVNLISSAVGAVGAGLLFLLF